jgi:hypothetical protein
MRSRRGHYLLILTALSLSVFFLSTCKRAPLGYHPDIDGELMRLASLSSTELPSVLTDLERDDTIGEYYRDGNTKGSVLIFFTELTGSKEVASLILESAQRYQIPASLAFAIAYEESRFNPAAFNDNGTSVDRGLFQLNSKSFPKLKISEFYDPAISARNGLSHFAFCLSSGGNEVAALAMYNAGSGRVAKDGTPRKTLDYIYRITKYQENISSLFAARVLSKGKMRVAEAGL